MRNVEIKAFAKDVSKLKCIAQSLSKSEGIVITQDDTFFNVPEGRLKLRKFEDGNGELIFYERPDVEGPKTCSYEKSKIPFETVNGISAVLTKALGEKVRIKKVRHLFLVEQTRIHIDSVEDLGDFVELEVVLNENQSSEEGEKIATELMSKLEISKADLISKAYADLLKKT